MVVGAGSEDTVRQVWQDPAQRRHREQPVRCKCIIHECPNLTKQPFL